MTAQNAKPQDVALSQAPPLPPLTLTMKEIRDAVPKHCFERSLLRGLSHLALDMAMITALGCAMWWVDTHAALPRAVIWAVWSLYWWWQGAVMTGIWVLAHECGHQSFSKWKSVNDAFGLVLHSALLVPYHSWRITHAQHHKHTNHTTADQVFVPATRAEYDSTHRIEHDERGVHTYRSALEEAMEETPIGDLIIIFKTLTLGWWAYLTVNAAGQDYGPGTNHYNPRARMFSKRDFYDIIVSDIGIVAALATIAYFSINFGLVTVLKFYFIPYMFVNMWLVLITYLQHSDPAIVHYKPKEFSFVRGALCTIDRDYGIYNWLHHRIGQTHVVHHLFSQMPFYHSQEATEAVKKVLGPYYYKDDTSIFQALRRSWKYCKFVDPTEGDLLYYRSYHESAAATADKKSS